MDAAADGLTLNVGALVRTVVAGQVANHLLRGHAYRIGRRGEVYCVPGSGGITLSHRVGDRAVGIAGDHVEPGASLRNSDRDGGGRGDAANRAFLALACVGNVCEVLTGPMAGRRGVVTGKHGGINHVIADFPPEVLAGMRIGDRVQVRAVGQGMALGGFPTVRCLNLAPALLRRWGIRRHGAHLHVPVTHVVPAGLLGSGLGRSDGVLGDCDIQLSDEAQADAWRLRHLRLGDLVAVWPAAFGYGPSRQADQVTFGVVVHGDSTVAGHGPGVTPLLVGPTSRLRPSFDPGANLALRLGLRDRIAPMPSPGPAEAARWREGPLAAAAPAKQVARVRAAREVRR